MLLDYFSWGYLKTVAYIDLPTSYNNFKKVEKITTAFIQFNEEQITKYATNGEFLLPTKACLNHNGEQFEQFIRLIIFNLKIIMYIK